MKAAIFSTILLAVASAALADGSPAVFTLGDLTISAPFSRATLPGAPVGGGFLSIANGGAEDDRLLSATSDVAGRVEIHAMTMHGDVMKMRALDEGLPIPAGQTVALTPGGTHMMLMDLTGPLVEGNVATVSLTFEKAGSIDIPLTVGAVNARSAATRK